MNTNKYKVIYWQDGKYYNAEVTDVQGCRTFAPAFELLPGRIREALDLFVDDAYSAELDFEKKET